MSPSCRFCFDNSDQLDLIRPCKCSGDSKFVHRRCLDEWRVKSQSPAAFTHCNVCKFEYLIATNEEEPGSCCCCESTIHKVASWWMMFLCFLFTRSMESCVVWECIVQVLIIALGTDYKWIINIASIMLYEILCAYFVLRAKRTKSKAQIVRDLSAMGEDVVRKLPNMAN